MRRLSITVVLAVMMMFIGVVVAEEDIIELYVGESIPLDTKVVSGEIIKDESGIVWTYSQEGICSISSNDTVTGKKAGKVTVTGNLNKGGSILEVQFDVLVKNTVKSVEATTPDQNLRVGEEFTATYNLIPVEMLSVPMNKGVSIKSLDTDVATSSSSGTIKIVGIGETYIQVESTESGKKDYIKVTVEPTVSKVSIDQKTLDIYVGETAYMTVTYTPIDGKEIYLKESVWKSFETSVATVDQEGKVVGKKAGKSSIRATSKDNEKYSTVSVDVLTGVKEVKISDEKIYLTDSNKTHQLDVDIIPVNGLTEAYEQGVTWKTSDSSICSVSSKGLLTGKKSGKVTITVESKDGGLKDYALVEVKLATTIVSDPTVKVKNIEFPNTKTDVKVGERVLIEYVVSPENANIDSIKMTVRTKDYGKIEKEDDKFYYTAFKDGLTFVDAHADGNKYAETLFFADTMLDGFEIDEDTFEKQLGTYTMYIGQKLEILPDFDMAIGNYPLLDDVKYTSSDTKVAKIVEDNYIEAQKIGIITLKGVTADNGYEDSVKVKVISNIKELETEKSARIGIEMAYQPSVHFVSIEDALYDLYEVLATDFTLELENIKISKEFVEKEIEYSKNRKEELGKLIDDQSGDLNEHLAELQECYQRLFDYEAVYKEKSGNFCDLTESGRTLTDRNYKELEIAKIKSNKLYAYVVSEIELKVISEDPEVDTDITVSVEDNVSSIVIFDEDGNIITASVEHILNHYTDDVLFQNNPSSWAVDFITLSNSKGLLVDEVIDNYQANITREEFMELVMNFYNVVLDFPEVTVTGNVFTDTDNQQVLKAYELGIISGRGPGIFAPNDRVTREEMCVIIDKSLAVMNRSLEEKKMFRNFDDASLISSWAVSAVDKMANDYDIIAGVGGNMFSPKGNATKEQAIIMINKVFNGLK